MDNGLDYFFKESYNWYMKFRHVLYFSFFWISTIIFRRKKPILGTIILTDKCNLSCKHCAVNNIKGEIYSYHQIRNDMKILYDQGIRILIFCGGEPFLWNNQNRNVRDLVIEAKQMGFLTVNVVTNGTFKLDLPEADLILVSLDGNRESHNLIRGEIFDIVLYNIRTAASSNLCLFMAINTINFKDIQYVCDIAVQEKNIRAVSFNFHTPYLGTEYLALTREQKEKCLENIKMLIKLKYPILNAQSAFSAIASNSFKPFFLGRIIENGKQSICGRCIEIDRLCENCGYFFAAECSLIFNGSIKVAFDIFSTYKKYLYKGN